jgi:hypothetical protein
LNCLFISLVIFLIFLSNFSSALEKELDPPSTTAHDSGLRTPFPLVDSVHARPIVSGPRNGYSPVVMEASNGFKRKVVTGSAGYVLEDVPHLSDYIPDLPVRRRFLEYIIHHSIKLLSLLLNLLTNLPFGG